MKSLALLLPLLLSLAGPASAAASPREADFGVVLGEPVGGTAEFWLDARRSLDFGAGLSDGNGAFWGDILAHDWGVLRQPEQGRLCGYLGLGPQFRTGDEARFGLRTIAGLLYRPRERPMEFYVEAGPLFRLTQGGHVDAVGGVGLRIRVGAASGSR